MHRSLSFITLFTFAAIGTAEADPAPAASPDAPAPAETPAPPPPVLATALPPTPATAVVPDVDLSSLGLDANGGGGFDDKLNIYGFADFSWTHTHFSHQTPYASDSTEFVLGNLNLYVAKNLTPRWRTLAEVRFMYAPNGSLNGDGTTAVTTATDAVNDYNPIQWGTISIERAYIEYDATSWLTIRAGHWLSPYGIWITDHGSPVIIPVSRPYMIGESLIPEHQTGLDLFGSHAFGDYQLGYHATISNGRGATEMLEDTNSRPAFGGRLEFAAPWAGTFKVGVSGYRGNYQGVLTSLTVPVEKFDEYAIAADAQWDHDGLHLQAETIYRSRKWDDVGRPLTLTGAPQVDGADFGIYGLAGYRFATLWNVMPFVFYEDYRPLESGLIGTVKDVDFGFNFRPTSSVILKLEESIGVTGNNGPITGSIYLTSTQIAWVF